MTSGAHAPVKDARNRPITAGGAVDGASIIFEDTTRRAGLDKFLHRSGGPQKATILETPGSGVALLDYDNDGWLDICLLNGSTFGALLRGEPAPHAMLFHNNHDGTFLAVVMPARGAAFGDLFNEGRIDVVINNVDSTPALLRSVLKNGNHWVTLKLVGGPKSPREAIGAKVFLTASGIRQRADVISGGSYASSSDLRVHFGLGAAKAAEVEIFWPSGLHQQFSLDSVDRIYQVEEGKSSFK